MIEPFALLVPVRQPKPFFAPQALNLLVIDPPAFHAQERTDFAVSVPSVLFGKPDQSETQIIVILLL
jgi:DsbC/DsbD-like thiol-disulfide interchange protein